MKHTARVKENGFSLVELLVVISVIGLIAAIAIPSMGRITDKAREGTALKNAQTICTMHTNAMEAGAAFSGTTKEAILEELIVGVTGELVPVDFKMSPMADDDRTAALEYCHYSSEQLIYDPSGELALEEEAGGCETWGNVFLASWHGSQQAAQIWVDANQNPNVQYSISFYNTWNVYGEQCLD